MKGLAIFGAVGLIVAAVVLMIVVAVNGPTNLMDLEVGQCFNADFEVDVVANVETVDCGVDHLAEVIAVGELNPDRARAYPADDDALFGEADVACAGVQRRVDGRFAIVPFPANEAAWEATAGRVLCVAIALGLVPTSGSALATATAE